jgi:succinate dehydrogenase / fumarate reductase cytochrome b subunit
MRNTSSSINAPRWFDPRNRQLGSWAFIVNRLSALGLTFYLGLHLTVLNRIAQGTQAYNDFVASAQTPWIRVGEVILIAAIVFHGLNGLRLILHAFGVGIHYRTNLLMVVTAMSILIASLFAMHLFGE